MHNGLQGTALLVIDIQKGLFEKKTPIYQATSLIQNINGVISKARAAGLPVIGIQHENNSFLKSGSEGWEFHPDLAVGYIDYFLRKNTGSAFKTKELTQLLDRLKIQELVIMGLVTNGCVKAATEDALVLGYRVVLIEDGHSNWLANAPDVIGETNARLSDLGAVLIKAEQLEFTHEGQTFSRSGEG